MYLSKVRKSLYNYYDIDNYVKIRKIPIGQNFKILRKNFGATADCSGFCSTSGGPKCQGFIVCWKNTGHRTGKKK